MAVSTPTGATPAADLQSLVAAYKDLANTQQSLQRQLNGRPGFSGIGSDGKSATGVPPGSLQARALAGGGIAFSVADASQNFSSEVQLNPTSGSTGTYLGLIQAAGAPTVASFPVTGNYGFYQNTSNGFVYFTVNNGGSLLYENIQGLSGTLTATLHGNLSGAGVILHDFTEIGGTITDTQHGSLGGGTDHADVTTSTDGFMIAADKVKLNTITNHLASATFDLSGNNLYIGNVLVLTAQLGHVANATNATDVITQLNALLSQLQAKSLMA